MGSNACVHGQGYVTCDDPLKRGCKAATSVFPSVEIAEKAARIRGWKQRSARCWICPDCSEPSPSPVAEHLSSD